MSYTDQINKKFSESTAYTHKNRLNRILREKLNIKTIENDAKKTLNIIENLTDGRSKTNNKPISDSSKVDLLTTLKALHREGVLQIKKEEYQLYEVRFQELKQLRDKQVSSNRQTTAQQGRTVDLKKVNQYLDKNVYDIDDAIIALYTYMPPRRGDIRDLQYTYKQPNENDKSNYIYLKNNQVILSFNNYKTQNKIGLQQFNLTNPDKRFPQQIQKTMKRLAVILKTFKKGEGSYLLTNRNDQPYDQSTFSRYITNLYKEKFNQNISIDILRQVYRTFIDNNYQLNLIQQQQIAYAMGHSLSQAVQYYKIDIEQNKVEQTDQLEEDLTNAEQIGTYILYRLRNGKIVFQKKGA